MGEVHKINVDMDKPCPKCGKGGSVNGGLCMDCAAKQMNKLDRIGPKVIETIAKRTQRLLTAYQTDLNIAYLREEDLTIALSVKLKPGKGQGIVIETKMSFVAEKIQESGTDIVDEAQGKLFGTDVAEKIQESGTDIVDEAQGKWFPCQLLMTRRTRTRGGKSHDMPT